MTEAARREPRVLADPAPSAWIAALGNSGIEMEGGFWIADPDQGHGRLRGAVLRNVLEACRTQGIEIPFPKSDVRLVNEAAPR
jgi:small-conductance mechanosensitive channel